MTPRYITKVYKMNNGMVAVFDQDLEQWAELQGPWVDVRKKIFQQLAEQDFDADLYLDKGLTE